MSGLTEEELKFELHRVEEVLRHANDMIEWYSEVKMYAEEQLREISGDLRELTKR